MAKKSSLSSDKCDWSISTPLLNAEGDGPDLLRNLRANLPTGRVRVDCDKCDWRVRTTDDVAEIAVETRLTKGLLDVQTSTPSFVGTLGSSKCDWVVRAVGAWPGVQNPPELEADLASDKCDFSLRLQFGVRSGRTYQIFATGSDKCDFHIDSRLVNGEPLG